MKTKKILRGALTAAAILLFAAVGAQADYYIPDIYSSSDPYPKTAHFDWINTQHGYGFDTAFSYSGGSLSYKVDFTLFAPGNWDDTTQPDANHQYASQGYRPQDTTYGPGYAYGSNINSEMTGGQANFSDVYSYFYTVDVDTGSNALKSIYIDFPNAALKDYGYLDTGLDNTADGSNDAISMSHFGNTIEILFGNLGSGYLTSSETATFYLTSQSWYGFNPTSASGHPSGSPSGTIPSPNPEASTVALYVVGLLGMAGYTYMKKYRADSIS